MRVPRLSPATRYWAAFISLAALSTGLLWGTRYLPMVDLPQHAAQVSMWIHLDDPGWGFGAQVERVLFTPYLLGYLVAVLFAEPFGVMAGMKVLLTIPLLCLPLVSRHLLLRGGGDPWWSLVAFPLFFGLSFYWGYLNFLFAAPLGLLFISLADDYSRRPTLRHGFRLAALGVVLFFCHILVLGLALVIGVLLVWLRNGGLRGLTARLAPFDPPLALMAVWVLQTWGEEARVQDYFHEWSRIPLRLGLLPTSLFDAGVWYRYGAREAWIDGGAAMLTLLMATALLLQRSSLSRESTAWIPFGTATATFLLFPFQAFGCLHVADRYALFLPLLLFPLLRLPPPSPTRAAARALIFLAVLGWTAVLGSRFAAFDAEARAFDALVAAVEPNRRVMGLVVEKESEAIPLAPLYLHFPAYIQAAKGGVLGFSIAGVPPEPMRYRRGGAPPASPWLEWEPFRFEWDVDGGYDYFIVRSEKDLSPRFFAGADRPVVLEGRSGLWWLYRKLPGSGLPPGYPDAAD